MKTRERASWRERRSRIRSLDYLNHYKSVSNHSNHSNYSVLLLLERGKGGGTTSNPFPGSISALLCFSYLLLLYMYSRAGYGVTCPEPVSKWSFLPNHLSSWLVGTGHAHCVQRWRPVSWSILVTWGGWVWSWGGCTWGCAQLTAAAIS